MKPDASIVTQDFSPESSDLSMPQPSAALRRSSEDFLHGGASGRYDYLGEIALDYAFLLTQLGLQE